ncbi:MAG: ABC transporter permease [Planctomycetes bacterium]|jgi:lipopolysaccharide transport system permease protein|nr:ABC transporter permease [Planctomycetota bacterium]MCL4730160.1 ABC transporter permease [Planctomycetota bacterium]
MALLADLGEIFRSRELAWMLGMREVRVRYKHTLLGLGWAVAQPLCLMLVFTLVFTRVARLDTAPVPYPVFVYIGLVPWQFHAAVLTGAARSLSDNRNLVTKVYFRREVLPLSVVLSALVDFAVAGVLVAGLMAWFGVKPGAGLLLVPVVIGVQLVLACGVALWVSAANLLYRDVQFILQLVVLVWMFASSVIWPIPRQGSLALLAWLNPMTPILDAYRGLIVGGQFTLAPEFGASAAISALVLVSGWLWFRRAEPRFGELA